jgi:hypothetical protein
MTKVVNIGMRTTRPTPNAVFHEVQHFTDNPLSYLMLVGGLVMIGFFIYAMIIQLVLGRPFGGKPMGDLLLVGFALFYIGLGILLLLFFYTGRLITEVRPDGIFIRFVPFHRRFQHFHFGELAKYESRTYRPVREFGGWGLRCGFQRKRAFNVSGNRGVQLTFKDGSVLLIGSRKADQLLGAIASIAR